MISACVRRNRPQTPAGRPRPHAFRRSRDPQGPPRGLREDWPRSVPAAVARPGRRGETSKETEARREETLAQGDRHSGRPAGVQALLCDPAETHGSSPVTALDLALSVPGSGRHRQEG